MALTIHNSKIDWDFIALTECWADRQDIENINLSIKGYNQVNCRKKFNQNGGVMVYIREDYKIEELEIENKDLGCEILSVRINKLTNNNMTSTNQGYSLNVIYRNPSRSKLTMINGIRELVAKTGSKGNAIYIGDFNIDLKENSQIAEDLKNNFAELGFQQIISEVTREGVNKGTIIDHCYINDVSNQIESGIIENAITDHWPIYVQIREGNAKINERKENRKTLIKNINFEKLRRDITNTNWNEILKEKDVNKSFYSLERKLKNLQDDSTITKWGTNRYNHAVKG